MEEYDIVINKFKTCYYKKGTQIKHRLDGPAYEDVFGVGFGILMENAID